MRKQICGIALVMILTLLSVPAMAADTGSAAEAAARQALSSSGGAREIRHLLQTCVQTPLADALLSGAAAGNRVVAAREGKLVVTVTGDDRTETGK